MASVWGFECPALHPTAEGLMTQGRSQPILSNRHISSFRRGENRPRGITRPGLSLWLTERDDETVVGKPIK